MRSVAKRFPSLSLFFLIIGCGMILGQEVPKNVTPFVALGYDLVIEIYRDPVIIDNQLVDKGPVSERRIIQTPVGSGTVISKEGLILTNYHVYNVSGYEYDAQNNIYVTYAPASKDMLVYILEDNNPLKEPVLKYVATPLTLHTVLDVCVLKIIADANTGQALSGKEFEYVKLGNPYDIQLNKELTVLGYPGKGGKTITITGGKFLGYTIGVSNVIDGSIKTDATMAGGNSGGTALYKKKLIGMPTRGSSKLEKGFDFGYIHPVSWANAPFSYAILKYKEKIPDFDEDWVINDYNTAVGKKHIYIGGKVYSAQSYSTVADATVLIYRKDRTFEQIVALIQEKQNVYTILNIQRLYKQGKSLEDIAAYFNVTVEQVQEILNTQIILESLSADFQKEYNGEFFYDTNTTDDEGFFFMAVPRGKNLSFYVEREGFRQLKKDINSGSGLYQDLGKIDIFEY
jgi:hypothetical protein